MQPGTLSTFLKRGAIWGFIVLELVFFTVAGKFLSLSENAFMDLDNMLLLFKQSAPIGIIAMGMTIIMINGNIDLSVGATYAICAIVLLDSMTWPIFAGLGDWVIPVGWLLALLMVTAVLLNWVSTGDHLFKTVVTDPYWPVAGVDLSLLASAAVAVFAARKLAQPRTVQASAQSREVVYD